MKVADTFKKAAGYFFQFDNSGESTPTATQGAMSDADFLKMMQSQQSNAVAGSASPKTVEQILHDSPGPNLDQIKVATSPQPQVQVLRPDGTVDFKAIYGLASVVDAPFTAEQLLELLATLPAELPLDARRQMVKITIQAMAKTVNVTPEAVVADASRKLAALASYEDSYGKQADEFVAHSSADIAALEAQIEAKKKAIEDAKQKHEAMNKACIAESDRLDDVLSFFSTNTPTAP